MVKPQINFEDFLKLDLRVGEVRDVREVGGSEKLLELQVFFGGEIGQKTIYSGIKKWFAAESLVGRKLIFVVNLVPKKFLIGAQELISEGMLLAVTLDDKAVLYSFDEDLPVGAVLR